MFYYKKHVDIYVYGYYLHSRLFLSYTVESFLFVGGLYSRIVKILLVRGDIISWVIGSVLLSYIARKFIMLLIVRGGVNSWTVVIHETHEH